MCVTCRCACLIGRGMCSKNKFCCGEHWDVKNDSGDCCASVRSRRDTVLECARVSNGEEDTCNLLCFTELLKLCASSAWSVQTKIFNTIPRMSSIIFRHFFFLGTALTSLADHTSCEIFADFYTKLDDMK